MNRAHRGERFPGTVDHSVFDRDEGPRADTTLEALGNRSRYSTARTQRGNSSQTSDKRPALVMSDAKARQLGLGRRPLRQPCSAHVPPETAGIGPVAAIPKPSPWRD
jgi:acetyl-CoA acyltransferase